MELIGLLLGMVTNPISWPVAVLIFVVLALVKGWIIPRSQSEALIAQHEKVENGLRETLSLVREDRDKSLSAMTSERDIWKETSARSQEIAQEVRTQNTHLIERLEVVDYMLTAMRDETGIQGGDPDERGRATTSPNEE